MTHLRLDDVGVEFALYQTRGRSLKNVLLRTAVGGGIGQAANHGYVVVRALDKLNLELREGDKLAIVGHNGAGKTTLLRVMAGIYHPTEGKVRTRGRRVPLFDIHSGFDDEATGYENIVLRGLLMGSTLAEVESRASEIAEFSGLGDFLDLPVRTYSSGMLLRLLFSISTSVPAEITLMDEWIATGDKDFLGKANDRLHDYITKSHILVFASHDAKLLRSVCNRAVLLNGGKIVMLGTPDEVLNAYAQDALYSQARPK